MGIFKTGWIDLRWGNDNKPIESESQEMAVIETPVKPSKRNPNEVQLVDEIVDAIVVPVKSDRITTPDHVSLMDLINDMIIIQPHIAKEFYDSLEYLAQCNPDVSNALENISLGNTKMITQFDDSVPEPLQKEMQQNLTYHRRTWWKFSDSTEGLSDALFTQAGIYGCTSVEGVMMNDLSGVKRIIMVNPKNIFFEYSHKDHEYHPLQRIPSTAGIMASIKNRSKLMGGEYVRLNETTYKYFPLRVVGETPYGIPPFLAAINNLVIQKDMIDNLKTVIEKIGLLGFLTVMLNKPDQKRGESEATYKQRLNEELTANVTEIRKGLSKGILGGYKDLHDVKLQPIGQNSTRGAQDLVNMNDTLVLAGLKFDPAMMGRSSTTTETFGRVILAKMGKQLENYQRIVSSVFDYFDLLHLKLQGYPVTEVRNSFERVMLGDEQRDAEAESTRIDNVIKLRDENIIDQTQAANRLGVDEPAGPAPEKNAFGEPNGNNPDGDSSSPDNPSNDDDPTDPKTTDANTAAAIFSLRGVSDTFEYHRNHAHCNCEQIKFEFNLSEDERFFWEGYLKAVEGQYGKASKVISRKVSDALKQIQEGVPVEQVITSVNYVIFTSWDDAFASKIKTFTKRFVRGAYKFYRRSQAPFGKKSGIPDPTFDLQDFRAMEYYVASDDLYLGRFITDFDTRRRINQWINKEYLEGNLPIGKDSKGIRLFQERFSNTLELEDWKIRRIIDTTLNRVRNTGALKYMEQAEVKEFVIRGVTDDLQCPYCLALQGKVFSVQKEITKLQSITTTSPDSVVSASPFATNIGLEPEQFRTMKSTEIQELGIGAPPFHPHCRDVITAKT